ncbi:MAG TPA: hypothetical protein VK489_04195 [Ferruginibacter sp.]|nr:hypothetical protein [Ferruginibacter sp.]
MTGTGVFDEVRRMIPALGFHGGIVVNLICSSFLLVKEKKNQFLHLHTNEEH